MLLRIFCAALSCCLFVPAAQAATLAFNGFEGAGGELPFTAMVEDDTEAEIVTQSNPPVFAGSQSLMFNKIGNQPQIDFDVVFDTVDLSNATDVTLDFRWHPNSNNNNYESADSLTFTIDHDGTGGQIVLSFDSGALNNARMGTSTDEWQTISESIPDDATFLDFSFNADFNANDEDMFFDELVITGTQVVPEPSSIALWTLLGLMGIGFGWRRLRR